MPCKLVECRKRLLKKDDDFLRFYAEDESAFQESEKKALENMKRNSGRLKRE